MAIALEATLILVLIAFAIGLVPLLFQLRRTAQNLDLFLLLSRKDLAQIAEDVHASRLRMDHLARSLQGSLDELSHFTHMLGDVGRTVGDLNQRFHAALDAVTGTLGGFGSLLGIGKGKASPTDSV
jgi:uncharacterized protein YoxC